MKLLDKIIKILFVVMILAGFGVGCGDDRSERIPTDDIVHVFPQTYDLSNDNMPYGVLIEFSPFNYLGELNTDGTGYFMLNSGAEGTLSCNDETGPSISFDFDDGVAECFYIPSNAEEVVTVFVAGGAYPYDIIATSRIDVVNQILDAEFSSDTINLSAYFFNSSVPNSGVNPNVLTYTWDFGNGTSSTDVNPTITYAAAGTYRVTLTVTEGAQSQSVSHSVVVTAAP